jgi:hypothetical protein
MPNQTNPLYCLVYASVSKQRWSDDELRKLLKSSRKRNEDKNITGMLLYLDPYFLQILEGKEEVVHKSFKKIKHDPRHHKVSVLYQKPIAERAFSSWTMGFNKVGHEDIMEVEGFSDFLLKPLHEFISHSPGIVDELLHKFKRETLF